MSLAIDSIALVPFIATAALTAYVASRKGRNVAGWFVLGLIFSIFALAAVVILPSLKPAPDGVVTSDSDSSTRLLAFVGKVFAGVFLGYMVLFAANGGAGGSSKVSGFAWGALIVYLAFFLPAVVRWAKQINKPDA